MPDVRGGAWIQGREIVVAGRGAAAGAPGGRLPAGRGAAAVRRCWSAQKAALAGCGPGGVTVKDTRSRWGSCAANGNLAFSWRLVMAPRFVQDYVAAHEVAHLRHMNHGARFWALVARLTPHTDAAMAWLREEGPKLLRVG